MLARETHGMRLGAALFRGTAALILALAVLVAPAAAANGGACATADPGPHAALVVDTGSGVQTFCVALDGDSVTGMHLIELAADQHGLEYAFGYGGAAVCRLAGVGVEGSDCFGAFPDFWGYWHGDGGGGWTWAPTGAASHGVVDGAVEGWSWGSGDSPETHASPPATTIEDVCGAPNDPSPPPDGGGTGGGGSGGGSGGGGTGGSGGGTGGQGSQPGGTAGGAGGDAGTVDPGSSRDQPGTSGGSDPAAGPDAGGPGASTAGSPEAGEGATGAGGAAAAPTGSGGDQVRAAAADDGGAVPTPGVAGALVVIAALAIGGWWRTRGRSGATR